MAKKSRTVSGASTATIPASEVGGDGNLASVAATPQLKEGETDLVDPTTAPVPADGEGTGVVLEGVVNELPSVEERVEDQPAPLKEEPQAPQLGGYVAAAQAASVQNAADAEPSGARSDNAEDMSMVAALSNYIELMAGNRRAKDEMLIKQQMNLYRAIKCICDSPQNDVMRRWGILLYYIDQGSDVNGAFTGNLPFRKLSQLPPQVQPLMEGLLGFLVAVGPEATRGAAIRHLSIPQVATALPVHAQDSFMSFFGQFV